MSIQIAGIDIENRVFLAPMSGVSDQPYRKIAARFGAGLVVTEMVASAELVEKREDVLRRTRSASSSSPFVIQLAGREAQWMAEAARISEGLGADIIDINMGCPARQVTGSLSGSALMRNLDHALELIEATVSAVAVPVTLKMRLGWDENTLNAADLAQRAEAAGIRMVTVHGRTRCQFFNGHADWAAIARVKCAVSIPVIANGDVQNVAHVDEMLSQSGADGVMVGRGAYGRPWLPGALSSALNGGTYRCPTLSDQRELVREHYEEMLVHYGSNLGVRCARKHLGWYVAQIEDHGVSLTPEDMKTWRRRLCQQDDASNVRREIDEFFTYAEDRRAA